MDFYLQGLALGLAYVAPIGMQNLFVINSALTQTRLRALVTALIVIFFDVTLALACFFGIGLVMQKYPPVQLGILLLGGLVVVYIGISLLKSSVRQIGGAQQMPLGKTVWAACVVTWSNAADCKSVPSGSMVQIHVPPPLYILPRSQVVRHQTLTLTFRWFEPTRGSHSYF